MGQNFGQMLSSMGASASDAMGQQYLVNQQNDRYAQQQALDAQRYKDSIAMNEANWARQNNSNELNALQSSYNDMTPEARQAPGGMAVLSRINNLRQISSLPYQQVAGAAQAANDTPINVPTGVSSLGVQIPQLYQPGQVLGMATTAAQKSNDARELQKTRLNGLLQIINNPEYADYFTKADKDRVNAALQTGDPTLIAAASNISYIPKSLQATRDALSQSLGLLEKLDPNDPLKASKLQEGQALVDKLLDPNVDPSVISQARQFTLGVGATVDRRNN